MRILARLGIVFAIALTGLSATPAMAQKAAPTPALSAQDQADIARAEQYFNTIRTFQARFVQNSSMGGREIKGNFYVSRPGKMRFEYDPPAKVVIVADGNQVTYYDAARDEISQIPLGWSSANFMVKDNLKLSGDLTVTRVDRNEGLLQLTVLQTKSPQEGYVVLVFGDNPLQFKRWSVIDAKGREVTISLTDMKTGVKLRNDLFYVDIDPNKANRQRP